MASKAQRQRALVEAKASLRLESLPISTRDDDLYAEAVDGSISGKLRDVVWREFALNWHQRRSLAVDRRASSAESAGRIQQFMASNCPIPGMPSAQRSQHGRGKRRKWVLRTRRVRTQHLGGRARRNGSHSFSRRNACGAGHSRAQRLGYVPRMRNHVLGLTGLIRLSYVAVTADLPSAPASSLCPAVL